MTVALSIHSFRGIKAEFYHIKDCSWVSINIQHEDETLELATTRFTIFGKPEDMKALADAIHSLKKEPTDEPKANMREVSTVLPPVP